MLTVAAVLRGWLYYKEFGVQNQIVTSKKSRKSERDLRLDSNLTYLSLLGWGAAAHSGRGGVVRTRGTSKSD